VLDFYCPELKLAIELDGSVHDVPAQKEYDEERQKHIENFGISFVRIRNEEFFGNPEKAFMKIEEEIRNLILNPSLPHSGI
jgi:very-short-patch-repair endonuclease